MVHSSSELFGKVGSADIATGREPKTEEFEVSVDLVEGVKVLLGSVTFASSSESAFSSLNFFSPLLYLNLESFHIVSFY